MKIGVLASHAGTTLQSVLDAIANKQLNAEVAVVISNNSSSGALQRAKSHHIATHHISANTHEDAADRDAAIRTALQGAGTDLVLLAGYMKPLGDSTLQAFSGRIINTHPSLLPKYGGQGFYGKRVHEAVLAAGENETGATVHIVTAEYDAGPIVAQVTVPVSDQDDVSSLTERVKQAEQALLLKVLGDWSDQTEDQGPRMANVTPGT